MPFTTGEETALSTADSSLSARIDASDMDFSVLHDLLRRGIRVGNERHDEDTHLNELVPKPWGQEYRAYADDFLDVWHLQINAGHATSMHAHPRKTTYLLCLGGAGATDTLTGTVAVRPGSVLRIGRGAFHSTRSTGDGPLMLLEVESPRNKYDLIRFKDGYRRAGTDYEQATRALRTRPRRVPFLPSARLCRTSPCGSFGFDLISGMDVHYRRRSSGMFLIPVGVRELAADEMEILTDDTSDDRRPQLDSYYLAAQKIS